MLLPFAAVLLGTTFRVNDHSGFASLHVTLDAGERVQAEPGCLVSYRGGMRLRLASSGGWLGRVFAGESAYFTSLEAPDDSACECMLCPSGIGDIHVLTLEADEAVYLQSGAFLAADAGVEVTSEAHRSLTGVFFSGTGLRHLCVKGPGQVAFNGHGALHQVPIARGETLSVDNGHVVAWSPALEMEIGWAARDSAWRSVASGEGLMCHFQGPGEVFVQSHALAPEVRSSSRRR